jgi:hypothetical protein
MLVKMWGKGRRRSQTVGGNVNEFSHYGNQDGVSSRSYKTELPFDPAGALLDTHLKEGK